MRGVAIEEHVKRREMPRETPAVLRAAPWFKVLVPMARGGEKTLTSENPDTDDIDFAWDDGTRAPKSVSDPATPTRWRDERSVPDASGVVQRDPPPREPMVTLPDDDPLRHDLVYDRKRDATRDSMPTIPDIDPLRHDVAEQQDAPSAAPNTHAPRRPA